ncbi:MAG: hypothetical protein LBR93_07550 [Treponema sp.]|jgi:hypothetical protein|nr:hypothetical protein [Treponema sp.]
MIRIGEFIPLARQDLSGPNGYSVKLAKLENFTLLSISPIQPVPPQPYIEPPNTLYTFQAVKPGLGLIQFARYYRPWAPDSIVYEPELQFNIGLADGETAEAGLKVGGWTPFVKPEGEALKVFEEALKGFEGVGYKSLLVSSQVVKGVNYIYAVNGKIVYPGAVEFPGLLSVYAPPVGKPRITHITRLGDPSALGGSGAFLPATEEEKGLLKKAQEGLMGGGFTAEYVSHQVVSGLRLHFIGTETLTDEALTKLPVYITVYVPAGADPVITDVQEVYHLV